MSADSRSQLLKSIDALRKRVETMPRGGDLEALLKEGVGGVNQALLAYLLSCREQAASGSEADFPPSGMSEVRGGDAPKRAKAPPRRDASRHG